MNDKEKADIFFTIMAGWTLLIVGVCFGISLIYLPHEMTPYMPLIERGVSISDNIGRLNKEIYSNNVRIKTLEHNMKFLVVSNQINLY